MELRFLGQYYSTSNTEIETIPSDHTASFRGQKYHLRRPFHTSKSQLGLRKYRLMPIILMIFMGKRGENHLIILVGLKLGCDRLHNFDNLLGKDINMTTLNFILKNVLILNY